MQHSKVKIPPVYLPEELVVITTLLQQWGVDEKCQNVELTGGKLFSHRHTTFISQHKCLNSGSDYVGI
jgi:hypothetical protein